MPVRYSKTPATESLSSELCFSPVYFLILNIHPAFLGDFHKAGTGRSQEPSREDARADSTLSPLMFKYSKHKSRKEEENNTSLYTFCNYPCRIPASCVF